MNLGDKINIILTSVFLLIVLSYYVLLVIKKKSPPKEKDFKSISIIIPAHNEKWYLKDAIQSVVDADFKGDKEIIVIDDGSKDNSFEIAKLFEKRFKEGEFKGKVHNFIVHKQKHSGKSITLNKGIELSSSEVIGVVDGDSWIHKSALNEIIVEVEAENVVAACCPVRVRNRKKFICMWLHIAEVYYSLLRTLFSRIYANITTPGPLSVYRKDALESIGGFSTDGLSEDADVTIRLIRKGYKIGFSETTIAETNMPHSVKEVFRQRFRFAKGLTKIFRKHLQINSTIIDIYTLPIFLFGYVQSVIMGSMTIYKVTTGYITYFTSKGIYLSWGVLKFFFEWFSLIGFVKWTFKVLSGADPLTLIAMVGIISTLLTYPLYFISFIKYDKKIDIWHIIPFVFLSPFWLILMFIQFMAIPEYFKKKQYNIWKKNE